MRQRLFVLAIFTGIAVFSLHLTAGEQQSDKPPVAVWKFDKSKGGEVNDSSGNRNVGKISNEVKTTSGRTGDALKFIPSKQRGKNGCVIITDISKKYGFFTRGITLEAWIKLNKSYRRNSTYEIITNTKSGRGKGFRFMINWGGVTFRSGEGGRGKTWGARSKPSDVKLKPEVWYHVAGVYNGSVFKVYIDGEFAGQSEVDLPLTIGRNDICIGAYCNGSAFGFDGIIDEVKIYDYPRSGIQILHDTTLP